ncbi:hypothetical protein HELRODRAFT_184377, partial [Helobdella robusta]|uniref:phospholipase A2 n=1 Tax=Helobdella robusta TaxID=6412 RepID=T1FL31_HELRO
QPVWEAVRATGAAPTYFRASGRFIDGGIVANNPTLDVLTEIHKYNLANRKLGSTKGLPQMHVVVSVGTGSPPVKFIEECDVYRPEGIMEFAKTTESDGQSVSRAAAWCNMINVPFFRFSPQLSDLIPLDCSDNITLINMLWETQCYLHSRHEKLVQLGKGELIEDGESLKLYCLKNVYCAIYSDPLSDSKFYRIFNENDLEAATKRYKLLNEKLPHLASCYKEVNVATLKHIVKSIERFPHYSLAHLSLIIDAENCLETENFLRCVDHSMLATKDASMLNELNNIGESALHEACLNKLPDNVNMLLQMGANSSLSASYRYPVHCAMQVDCISCVEVLHEYDNDVLKLAEKIYGNTAMHCLKSKQ